MVNIVVSNKAILEKKLESIKKRGLDNTFVISDFDRTLTKAFTEDGGFVPSAVSVLRDKCVLSEEYSSEANKLFKKYHEYEISTSLSLVEKKILMRQWWEEHFSLLLKSGLKKKDLDLVWDSERLELRKGLREVLSFLESKEIPLLVFSASVIGVDSDKLIFGENVSVVSNQPQWNEEGVIVSFKEPYIHSLNKNFSVLNQFSKASRLVSDKDNVILMGDSLGDSGMADDKDFENVLRIGFLNMDVSENLDSFKQAYDIVITNDGDMDEVLSILKNLT